MTASNKQNQSQQSQVDNFFSLLSAKFEWLAKVPTRQFPGKYAVVLVGIIVVIFAWKFIAVSKVEADMVKKLEQERVLITQQAREYADKQYIKEEERFGQILSWAVRGELIRNNIDQIDQYLNEIVKMKDTERVDVYKRQIKDMIQVINYFPDIITGIQRIVTAVSRIKIS